MKIMKKGKLYRMVRVNDNDDTNDDCASKCTTSVWMCTKKVTKKDYSAENTSDLKNSIKLVFGSKECEECCRNFSGCWDLPMYFFEPRNMTVVEL